MGTTKEMLDDVNKAITSVMAGGQSYRIGSRQLSRADLKELYKIRNDLQAQLLQEEASTGLLDGCYVGVFDGR